MAKAGMLKEVQSRIGTQDSRSVNIMVKDILIGDITIRENVRKDYTEISELADSIRQYGLLQPITVYADGDQYIVKTGHRRFLASQLLYKKEPDKFHSVRCIISNADNCTVIQLVENVQRENLSQVDLYNALSTLRDQGMTLKQIADVMGKGEGYIKNLFVGINDIQKNEKMLDFISNAGVTIQEVKDTKGVPDNERTKLLAKRANGEITRAEMRQRVKALKEDDPIQNETPTASAIPQPLPSQLCTAATIAQERLHQYILDKVEDKWDDQAIWEFYTWLLEQTKHHAVDRSGFISEAYKADKEQAKQLAR
jgi:ParB family chromosome partitioning protein